MPSLKRMAEVAAENIAVTAPENEAPRVIVKTAVPPVVRNVMRRSLLVYWCELAISLA